MYTKNNKQTLNPKIDAGLELISALGTTELTTIEIRDLLHDLISKNYNTVDDILEVAQEKSLLQRTKETWLVTPEESNLGFEKPKIVKQEENSHCKLCGHKISVGYYVQLRSNTYGPYGSTCVHKIHLGYLL